jgi:hypothetical protein
MTIKGINALCDCDTEEYSLFSGKETISYETISGSWNYATGYIKQKILMFTIRTFHNITKINH